MNGLLDWFKKTDENVAADSDLKAARLARDKAVAEAEYREAELTRLTAEKRSEYLDKVRSEDVEEIRRREELERFYDLRREAGKRIAILALMTESWIHNHSAEIKAVPEAVIESYCQALDRGDLLQLFGFSIAAKRRQVQETADAIARIERDNAHAAAIQAKLDRQRFDKLPELPQPEPSMLRRDRDSEDYLPIP